MSRKKPVGNFPDGLRFGNFHVFWMEMMIHWDWNFGSGALDHWNCCGIDVLGRCLLRHEPGAFGHKKCFPWMGKGNPGPGTPTSVSTRVQTASRMWRIFDL